MSESKVVDMDHLEILARLDALGEILSGRYVELAALHYSALVDAAPTPPASPDAAHAPADVRSNSIEHDLKCWPDFFCAILSGIKAFEVRQNDRGFQVGDVLNLREWNPETQEYTGRSCKKTVTYLTGFNQQPGYVVMSLSSLVIPAPADGVELTAHTIIYFRRHAVNAVEEAICDQALAAIALIAHIKEWTIAWQKEKDKAEAVEREVKRVTVERDESVAIIEDTMNMLHADAKSAMPTLASAVAWCRNEIDMLRSAIDKQRNAAAQEEK